MQTCYTNLAFYHIVLSFSYLLFDIPKKSVSVTISLKNVIPADVTAGSFQTHRLYPSLHKADKTYL